MGKRWTDEEKAIMRKHYPTARSVEDIAAMLGRPKCSVIKSALAMGLSRPDLHDEAVKRIVNALSDIPMSSRQISDAIGVTRGNVNRVLACMSDEGLCHIATYRKRPGRGSDIPLWVLGEGDDAKNEWVKEVAVRPVERAATPVTPVIAFRDPFTAMFYGEAA